MRKVATLMLVVLACVATVAEAQQKPPAPPEKGTRIYQTDHYGRVQHHKPSWVVKENGRLVEVSPIGSEQSHKQQYKIDGSRVYPTDYAGRVQYNKPSYEVGKDGHVVQMSTTGRPQYNDPQFVVKGSKVYAADTYGRERQQAFEELCDKGVHFVHAPLWAKEGALQNWGLCRCYGPDGITIELMQAPEGVPLDAATGFLMDD